MRIIEFHILLMLFFVSGCGSNSQDIQQERLSVSTEFLNYIVKKDYIKIKSFHIQGAISSEEDLIYKVDRAAKALSYFGDISEYNLTIKDEKNSEFTEYTFMYESKAEIKDEPLGAEISIFFFKDENPAQIAYFQVWVDYKKKEISPLSVNLRL